jgi:putative transposase
MKFQKDHRPKIYSINSIERLNSEIKRRTDVVGIFPNEEAVTHFICARLGFICLKFYAAIAC